MRLTSKGNVESTVGHTLLSQLLPGHILNTDVHLWASKANHLEFD